MTTTDNTLEVTNKRVTMLVTFNVKEDRKEELKKALIADKQGALTENGNISMELFEHRDQHNTFYLFERWENQQALDAHFTKEYAKAVLELNKTALTSPMDILYLEDFSPLPKNDIKKPSLNDNMVDLFVFFQVKDGKQDIFIKQFEKSIAFSRPETGNVQFFFHTINGDNTRYVLYERWRNQEAIDFHFAQPYTVELFEMFKSALEKPIEEYLNFIQEIK